MSAPSPSSAPAAPGSAAPAAAPLCLPADAHPGWLLLRGAIAIVFGLVAFVLPLATIASLVIIFAAYLLADGLVALVDAVRAARGRRPWRGAALEGVANLVAGLIALLWPGITLVALVWLSGFWAIVSGTLLAYAGVRSHAARGRWLRVVAGVLSAVWGVLLLVAPLPGAVVMTFWLGAYAIVFGLALLVAGMRARRAATAVAAPPLQQPT